MQIELKTKEEIAKMRLGGKIASRILDELKSKVKAGVTTAELDKMAAKMIVHAGAKPSFKGFNGYPNALCVSVNDEVVHGIPKARVLKNSDIVGLDIGVFYQGFHTDTARTYGVGRIENKAQRLLDVTWKSLEEGIKMAKPGNHLGDIQAAIQRTAEKAGFGVVRDLVGHGVGRKLQELPAIPNYGNPGTGPKLEVGMTLAIEPMITAGDWHVKILEDGWTVVTLDGSFSAHFEHTIAITKNGVEILTR